MTDDGRPGSRQRWTAFAPVVIAAILTACTRSPAPAAVTSPSPSLPPSSFPATASVAKNGPLTIFGFLGGLKSVSLAGGRPHILMPCHGSCTLIPGADWSTDGRQVVFTAVCAGGCGTFGDPYHGVRIADPSVGTDALLMASDDVQGVALSPDGSQIAFVASDPTNYNRQHLSVMAPAGSGRRTLTGASGVVSAPSWSPDGEWITYSGLEEHESVFIVRADGSEPPLAVAAGDRPAWSPDGTRILYAMDCRLWTMAPDGSHREAVIRLAGLGSRKCHVIAGPVWSPDGTRIAVSVAGGLYVMNADGGQPGRLLRNPPIGLAWQPRAS